MVEQVVELCFEQCSQISGNLTTLLSDAVHANDALLRGMAEKADGVSMAAQASVALISEIQGAAATIQRNLETIIQITLANVVISGIGVMVSFFLVASRRKEEAFHLAHPAL